MQSCHEEVFEREPLDKISSSDVWEQESLIRNYISDMYASFPFFTYPMGEMTAADISTQRHGNQGSLTTGGMSHFNDDLGYWNYELVREANRFLENIADANIEESTKRQMEGEVRTIRAVIYFEMQKRYGGLPLVDVVLDPFEDIEEQEQYLKRSTEESVADFIDSELDKAIGLLKEDPKPTGKINKWIAYSYKARANLWAASIAKYASVELNGVVGIPANRANEFYGKAAEAARTVIQSGNYELYNEIGNKEENYRNIFLDDGNSEIIFEKLYDGVDIAHSFSHMNYPTRLSAGQGSHLNPLLEFLYSFENIDGSKTQPEFGPEHLYEDGIEPWENKDPRLHATVFFQGEEYAGYTIQTYDGLDPSPTPNPDAIIASSAESYEGVPSVGPDSRLSDQHFRTQSGFLIRKYIIDEPLVERNTMTTSWKEIRLAELYLILAESEFEMENYGTAATALNEIRERAGISSIDASNITREDIRNERKVELAFEGFRWWDLRRWRIARDILERDEPFQGLHIILHYETNQFYFMPMDAEEFTRAFSFEHYYNPITDSRMENNKYLIENPGYD